MTSQTKAQSPVPVPKSPVQMKPENDRDRQAAEYEALLAKMGQRERLAVEKHIAACEAETTMDHAELWKQLAILLSRLTLASTKTASGGPLTTNAGRQSAMQSSGQKALQFFVPDGKYRRQVFALEDARDGVLIVYAIDTLKQALKSGALSGPLARPIGERSAATYRAGGDGPGSISVSIELLNAANVGTAPDYYRHMVGWNRTALRIALQIGTGADGAASLRALTPLLEMAARAGS